MDRDAVAALASEGLTVQLGDTRVVDDVDVALRPGELLGLVGPNGAGKTTLLRALLGLLPARGTVVLAGQPLAALGPRATARLAASVPQAGSAVGSFSAEETVLAGRTPHLRSFLQWETAHDRDVAWQAMDQTATAPLAERLVAELSGGERQRVLLARALAQEPRVLLLDEPTANLDLGHQVRVLGLVRRLVDEAGLAAIAAIHDLELAARFCHRLLLLHAGRVVAEGPPNAVLTPANLEQVYGVRAVVEANPHVAGLRITVLDAEPPPD